MALRRSFVLVLLLACLAVPKDDEMSLDLGNRVYLDFMQIPSGDFQMGESEVTRNLIGLFCSHELTARQIVITRDFYLGKYEVTVQQFRRFVEATGYKTDAESAHHPAAGSGRGCYTIVNGEWTSKSDASWMSPGFPQTDRHPVTCVSWYDAMEFTKWVSAQTKKKCRLPTEAELEDAGRAWTVTRYYWGNNPNLSPVHSANIGGERLGSGYWANVADESFAAVADDDLPLDKAVIMRTPIPEKRNDHYLYTAPVGSFYPNPFGLYDMVGNVWEYTLDWAGDNPAGKDPHGGDSAIKSMRGGSWLSSPDVFRSSYRPEIAPGGRTSTRGFRVLVEEE